MPSPKIRRVTGMEPEKGDLDYYDFLLARDVAPYKREIKVLTDVLSHERSQIKVLNTLNQNILKENELIKGGNRPASKALLGSYFYLTRHMWRFDAFIVKFIQDLPKADDGIEHQLRSQLAYALRLVIADKSQVAKHRLEIYNRQITESELNARVARMKEEIKGFMKKLKGFKPACDEIDKLREEVVDLKTEIRSLERKHRDAVDATKSYKESNDKINGRLQRRLQAAKKETESLKRQQAMTDFEHNRTQERLIDDLKAAKHQNAQHQEDLDEKDFQIAELKRTIDSLSHDKVRTEVQDDELRIENRDLVMDNEVLKQSVERSDNEKAKMRAQIETLQRDKQEMTDNRKRHEAHDDELRNNFHQLKSTTGEFDEILKIVRDKENLESSVVRSDTEKSELIAQIAKLQRGNEKLVDKLKHREAHNDQLRYDFQHLKSTMQEFQETILSKTAEIDQLQQQLKQHNKAEQRLRDKIDRRNREVKELKEQLQEPSSVEQSLRDRIKRRNDEIEDLSTRLAEALSANDFLDTKTKAAERKQDLLETFMAEQTDNFHLEIMDNSLRHEQEISQLKTEIEQLEKTNEDLIAELGRNLAPFDRLTRYQEELETARQLMAEKCKNMVETHEYQKLEIRSLKNEKAALMKQLKAYQTARQECRPSRLISHKPQTTSTGPPDDESDGSPDAGDDTNDQFYTAVPADDNTLVRAPLSKAGDGLRRDVPDLALSRNELLAKVEELREQLQTQVEDAVNMLVLKGEAHRDEMEDMRKSYDEKISSLESHKWMLLQEHEGFWLKIVELKKQLGDSSGQRAGDGSGAVLAGAARGGGAQEQSGETEAIMLAMIKNLKQQVQGVDADLSLARQEKERSGARIDELERQLEASLQKTVADGPVVVSECGSSVYSQDDGREVRLSLNGTLKQRVDKLGADLSEARREKERLHMRIGELEVDLATSLGARDVEGSGTVLATGSNEDVAQLQSGKRHLLLSQIESLLQEVDRLNAKRNSQHLIDDLDDNADEVGKLHARIYEYEIKEQENDLRVKKLEEKLGGLEEMILVREEDITDLTAKNAELATKLNDLSEQIEKLKSEYRTAKDLAQRLKQEKYQLQNELSHAQRAAHDFRSENVVIREQNKRMSTMSMSVNPMSDDLRSPSMGGGSLQRQASIRHHGHRESVSSAFEGLPPPPFTPGGLYVSSPRISSPTPDLSNPRLSLAGVPRRAPLGSSLSRGTAHHVLQQQLSDLRSPRSLLAPSVLREGGSRSISMPEPVVNSPTVPSKPAVAEEQPADDTIPILSSNIPLQIPITEVEPPISTQERCEDKVPTQSTHAATPKATTEAPVELAAALKAIDKTLGMIKSGTVANTKARVKSDSSLPGALRASGSLVNLKENMFIKADSAAHSKATAGSVAGTGKVPHGDTLGKAPGHAPQSLVQARTQQFLDSSQKLSSTTQKKLLLSPTRVRAVSEGAGKLRDNPKTAAISANLEVVLGAGQVPGPLLNRKLRGPTQGSRIPLALNFRASSLASSTVPAKPSPLAYSFGPKKAARGGESDEPMPSSPPIDLRKAGGKGGKGRGA